MTILPQRGAQVTSLSVDEVQDIFEIRAHLMGLACHRLARALPADKTAELERLLEALQRALEDGDAYARASLAISEFCVRHAGSRRLADLILSFGRQTARYTRLSLSTSERRRQSSANWSKLVKAVIAGDASDAERTARQLVLDTRDTALQLLIQSSSEQLLAIV